MIRIPLSTMRTGILGGGPDPSSHLTSDTNTSLIISFLLFFCSFVLLLFFFCSFVLLFFCSLFVLFVLLFFCSFLLLVFFFCSSLVLVLLFLFVCSFVLRFVSLFILLLFSDRSGNLTGRGHWKTPGSGLRVRLRVMVRLRAKDKS